MSSSFFKTFYFFIILIFLVPIIITFLFVPSISNNLDKNIINSTKSNYISSTLQIDTNNFVWPTPRI